MDASVCQGTRTKEQFIDLIDVLNHSFAFQAMAHIHSMNPKVIHRDLKTQNLLLFQDYQILKICDFGTASSVDGTNMVGTVNYMAPEVRSHQFSALYFQWSQSSLIDFLSKKIRTKIKIKILVPTGNALQCRKQVH